MKQPSSIKGLKILLTSISIISILILVSLAYSGYQEITYLIQQGSNFKVDMNATSFSISSFKLENRGIYPLTFSLNSELTLEGVNLESYSTGSLTINPGDYQKINFSIPIRIDLAYNNSLLIGKLLFNNTYTNIYFNIIGGVQPFFMGSISREINNTLGAVLDGFNLLISDLTPYNQTHLKMSVIVKFTNRSPLNLDANLSARVISTPQQPTMGNYGSGSTTISSYHMQYYEESFNIYLINGLQGQGTYILELNLSSKEFTYSWKTSLRR